MRSISVTDAARGAWGETLALDARHRPMVARLDAAAAGDAAGYRRRVVVAGLLGYAVLGGLIALLVGLSVLMVVLMVTTRSGAAAAVKGLLIFGGLSFAMLRALALARIEPDGVAVDADDAPALYATLARLRAATGGPRIDAVRVTADLNAAVTQESRWFGLRARNTLYLGLPLLQALATREVEAVIAHELGHFAGSHGRSAGFAYAIRRRWMQVAERLPDGVVAGLLRRFFGWYGPWFAAYSFVLARRQEYEADAAAARATDAQTAGDALMRVAIQAARHDTFWEVIWEQAMRRDDPPRSPHLLLVDAFAGGDEAAAKLEAALVREPGLDDTHPTLLQRLDALGVAPAVPRPYTPAADALLGDLVVPLMERFDADWHAAADETWAARFTEAEAARAERDALAADEPADGDAAFRHAALVEWLDGSAAAVPLWRAAVDRFGDDAARFRHGAALIDAGDPAGSAILRDLAATNVDFALPAWQRIVAFADSDADVTADRAALAAAEERAALARTEAARIDENAVLRALDPALREAVAAAVAVVDGVKTLDAALRDVAHAAGPQIAFVFTPAKGHVAAAVLDELVEALWPLGDVLGIERHWRRRWLARRIAALPGSRIVP